MIIRQPARDLVPSIYGVHQLLNAERYDEVRAIIAESTTLHNSGNFGSLVSTCNRLDRETNPSPGLHKALRQYVEKVAGMPNSDSEDISELIYNFLASSTVSDMFEDFTTRITIPLYGELFEQYGIRGTEYEYIPNLIEHTAIALIQGALSKGESCGQILDKFEQLSRTWHHPAITFDTTGFDPIPEGLESTEGYRWHPILTQPFHTKNHVIHCLTNQLELKEESRLLGHCVGKGPTYGSRCAHRNGHILSIRTPKGKPLSTVELKLVTCDEHVDSMMHIVMPDQRHCLHVIQHESANERDITSGALYDSLQQLLQAIQDGKAPIQTSQLGETQESAATKYDSLDLTRECGYYPTASNLNRAFQQFKEARRRGSDKLIDEKLHYSATDDGYDLKLHLLDGTITTKDGTFSYRDMDAHEWAEASGLMKALHKEFIHQL